MRPQLAVLFSSEGEFGRGFQRPIFLSSGSEVSMGRGAGLKGRALGFFQNRPRDQEFERREDAGWKEVN